MQALLILLYAFMVFGQNDSTLVPTTSSSAPATTTSVTATTIIPVMPSVLTSTIIGLRMTTITTEESAEMTTLSPICNPRDPWTCGKNGICIDLKEPGVFTCRCDPRFLGAQCEIEQKSRVLAFVLEFPFGHFGVGDFYLGRTAAGIVRLLICILFLIIGGINTRYLAHEGRNSCTLVLTLISLPFFVTLVIWWIVNLVLISNGTYYGNGVPTYADM